MSATKILDVSDKPSKLIAAWEHYRDCVYGPEGSISAMQEEECRNAFIAGVGWLYAHLIALPDGEEGGKMIDALEAEITEFFEKLRASDSDIKQSLN